MLPLESLYKGRCLTLAHRGACKAAPENTLPAFERALEMGADGFELDVHLTFDDVPIVLHDFKLEKTTDGEGYPTEHPLETIKSLDAGSHFGPEFAGTSIPTLGEVLTTFPDAVVNIEIKSLTPDDTGLERAVVEAVHTHQAGGRVILSSFNPFCLRRVRKLAPELPVGNLLDVDLPFLLRKGILMWGVKQEAVHPAAPMVDKAFVASAHKKGRRVNVWAANEPDEMQRLIDLGVDAIITDRPDLLRQQLG